MGSKVNEFLWSLQLQDGRELRESQRYGEQTRRRFVPQQDNVVKV